MHSGLVPGWSSEGRERAAQAEPRGECPAGRGASAEALRQERAESRSRVFADEPGWRVPRSVVSYGFLVRSGRLNPRMA